MPKPQHIHLTSSKALTRRQLLGRSLLFSVGAFYLEKWGKGDLNFGVESKEK